VLLRRVWSFGTALPEKIGGFYSSSLKMAPTFPYLICPRPHRGPHVLGHAPALLPVRGHAARGPYCQSDSPRSRLYETSLQGEQMTLQHDSTGPPYLRSSSATCLLCPGRKTLV
jgi:hypothetical protein